MIVRFIKPILLFTGTLTLLPLLKFLFPDGGFPPGPEILGEGARLVARHQALEVATFGGLLVYAAFNTAARVPIMVGAIIGKGGMAYLLLQQLGNPAFAMTRGTLIVDVVCVVLYSLYLLQSHKASA